jgi:hypothetical protein
MRQNNKSSNRAAHLPRHPARACRARARNPAASSCFFFVFWVVGCRRVAELPDTGLSLLETGNSRREPLQSWEKWRREWSGFVGEPGCPGAWLPCACHPGLAPGYLYIINRQDLLSGRHFTCSLVAGLTPTTCDAANGRIPGATRRQPRRGVCRVMFRCPPKELT